MDNDLTFLSETDDYYTVKNEREHVIDLPRKGGVGSSLYKPLPKKFHPGWLQLAFFGLSLGGLLAVIFGPLEIWDNLSLLRNKELNQEEIVHAKNYLLVSLILLFFGAIFFILFLIHLIYV